MRVGCGVALIVSVLALMAPGGAAVARPVHPQAGPHQSTYGQVYLFRGLMGAVLSTGLDTLSARLQQRGIQAPVYAYESYGSLADEALARWRAGNHGPIIIIGHSFGAISAVDMAKMLQASHVPVSLIVAFGPIGDLKAPANVSSVVNYYQSKSYSNGRLLPGPGFHGAISNVDLETSSEINHVNLVQVARLHAQVITRVMALLGNHPAPPAANATAGPTPAAPVAPATNGAN